MHSAFQFDYYGTQCEVFTTSQFFQGLLRQKFGNFFSGATKNLTQQKIIIEFYEVSSLPVTPKDAIYFSPVLCRTPSKLIFEHDYLTTKAQVRMSFQQNKVEKIEIFFKNSIAFQALNSFSKQIYLRQLFQIYIKQYIELTLLWQIVLERSIECIHAAAIEKDGEVLIFAGLNGVGKTTLAMSLVQKHGYKLFADNYLLLNSSEAFKSPDSPRLENLELVKQSDFSNAGEFGFAKHVLSVPVEMKSSLLSARIKAIYFVQRGSTWDLKKGSAEEIMNTIRQLQIVHGESVANAVVSHLQPTAQMELDTVPKVPYFLITVGKISELPAQYFL
jgi:hypothetical protein